MEFTTVVIVYKLSLQGKTAAKKTPRYVMQWYEINLGNDSTFAHRAINPFLLPVTAAVVSVLIDDNAIYWRVHILETKLFLTL